MKSDLLNPKKILIINIFGIGDVLFTTPLIRNLKMNYPSVQIDYMANKRAGALLLDYEKINKVYFYERDELVALRRRSTRGFLRKVYDLMSDIRGEQYDVLFDFSMNQMFCVMGLLSGINNRIGFNYKNRSPYLTQKLNLKGFEGKHIVRYYLDLLESCGLKVSLQGLEMTIPEQEQRWAVDFLRKKGVNTDKLTIGIMPGGGSSWGSSANLKRWPKEKYIKLIDKIIEKYSAQIILMGDKTEELLCSQIARECPKVFKAFGETDLCQLAAILKTCNCVVLNDGGPLHMAVSVGTKTISIFGPVDEKVYGPWMNDEDHAVVTSDIICRPCYTRFRMSNCKHISCLQEININDVLMKMDKILK